MKKKLLTVLLAVVMVFGVFGLTACGGSNPDEDYNYYSSKYGIDGALISAPIADTLAFLLAIILILYELSSWKKKKFI